jgi:hypothetical protein
MPIAVTCPNGHKLRVKDALGGKRVACPKCKAPFRIPTVDEYEADIAPPELLEDRPAAKPSAGGKACPSCGAALAPDSVLCIDCGLDLRSGKSLQAMSAKSAAPARAHGRRPKSKRSEITANFASPKILLLAGGAGAAVAAVLVVYFFVLGSDSPEATARAFMVASQDGDVDAVKALLTDKARELVESQLAVAGMPGRMPGAKGLEVKYRVGQAATSGDTAKVPVTTDVNGPAGQQQITTTLLLRRERGAWRVYGMSVTGGPGGMELTMDFENPQASAEALKQSLNDALAKKGTAAGGELGRRTSAGPDGGEAQMPSLSLADQPALGELDAEMPIPGFPQYRLRPPKGFTKTQNVRSPRAHLVWMGSQGSSLSLAMSELSEAEANWKLERALANFLAGLRSSLVAGSTLEAGEAVHAQIGGIDFLRADLSARIGPQQIETKGFCYVGHDGRTLVILHGVERAELGTLDLLERAAQSLTKSAEAQLAEAGSFQLDAELAVPGLEAYRVQPPKGFEMQQASDPRSGVKIVAWVGLPRADGTSPMIMVTHATAPPGGRRYSAEEALEKDLDALRRSKGAGFQATAAQPRNINGIAFVGAYWSGTHPQTGGKLHGFSFVTVDGAEVIYLKSQDAEPHHEEALRFAEDCAMTFRKAPGQ